MAYAVQFYLKKDGNWTNKACPSVYYRCVMSYKMSDNTVRQSRPIGESVELMTQSDAVWGGLGQFGALWGGIERCGAMLGGVWRCRVVQGDVGRCI